MMMQNAPRRRGYEQQTENREGYEKPANLSLPNH